MLNLDANYLTLNLDLNSITYQEQQSTAYSVSYSVSHVVYLANKLDFNNIFDMVILQTSDESSKAAAINSLFTT